MRRAEHVLRLSPPLLLGGVVVALLLACRGPAGTTSGALPYLDDASYRRSELLASLVSPKDGYATLREAFYATGKAGDWDELEEWDPPVRRVAVEELDGRGSRDEQAARSSVLALPPPPSSEDDPSLLAFGRAAFQSYPVQAAPYLEVAIASRESAARYGLWLDDERGVGGLVRARMADGTEVVSVTCCTCHARRVGSRIVDGLPNANLELGEAILDATRGTVDPAIAAWGAGRIDVSSRSGTEPARIPDLRPVAWLGYLQQDATVRVVDRTSLAIRIETLIITSQNEAVRPPRIVTLALAAYVRSLASELTGSPADGARARRPHLRRSVRRVSPASGPDRSADRARRHRDGSDVGAFARTRHRPLPRPFAARRRLARAAPARRDRPLGLGSLRPGSPDRSVHREAARLGRGPGAPLRPRSRRLRSRGARRVRAVALATATTERCKSVATSPLERT